MARAGSTASTGTPAAPGTGDAAGEEGTGPSGVTSFLLKML